MQTGRGRERSRKRDWEIMHDEDQQTEKEISRETDSAWERETYRDRKQEGRQTVSRQMTADRKRERNTDKLKD